MYRVVDISLGPTNKDKTEELNALEQEGYRYVGTLMSAYGTAVILHRRGESPRRWVLDRIADLLRESVEVDGSHHKQWYLEQIAEGLEIELPSHDLGIAP